MAESEKKRKSPQGAVCNNCKAVIPRGSSVCRKCYETVRDNLWARRSQLEEEEKERIKVEAEVERLRGRDSQLTDVEEIRNQVLSPNFVFSVSTEVKASDWTPDPIPEPLRDKGKIVLEISDSGVSRVRMYLPEAREIATLIKAISLTQPMSNIEEKP